MTTREQLLDALAPLGFRDGRIDLPVLWPAVKAWLLEPATAGGPSSEERTFRELRLRDGNASTKLADVGLVLWYADGPAWKPLEAEPDWIAAGPGTPHIDAFADEDGTPRLIRFIEGSLAFTVASEQPPLAAEIADGVADNLVVLAAA